MPDAKDILMSIVGRVADGQPIDWSRAESTPMSEDERSLLAQLKVLDGLHQLHRSGPAVSSARTPDSAHTVHLHVDPRAAPIDMAETNVGTSEMPIPQHWGPLEIRSVLGIGGFGVVYRAWDPHLASEVALKVLTREKSSVGETVIKEARHLARVRHPNVVSIYGADRWEGEIGLWMELVRGRTLKQLVKQQGTFGAREAALVGLDLTRALAAVHGAGLVHRDVKPHNVMRDESGRIVLMDFGAGVDMQELTAGSQSKFIGTPLYMAPELFDRQQPSAQTDLYSLGILLYHLVTGLYPLDGSSPSDMRVKHQRGERRRLRDARPDLPTEFVRIVERAIEPTATARYGSAGELESDLAQFVVRDERSSEAVPAAAGAPPQRPGVSRSALALAAAAVVVVALAGVAALRFAPSRAAPVTPSAPVIRSLVVLPLRNASGDPAQDYFVDGMTELLTADLSGVSALRVIADSAAARYRNAKKSGADIGRELHVDGVVEGSVSRSGDRVRVTLQVIHAGTNLSVWGSSFEREAGDAFRLQAEIAQTVVTQVRSAITAGEQQRLARVYVPSAEAQDLYLRGRYLIHTYAGDQLPQARVLFERAVQVDPQYALAWTSLARCYTLMQGYGLLSPAESKRLGSAAASRAIAIDSNMFEAHSTLAEALFKFDWNWNDADAHYRQALAANPSFSLGRTQYARFLSAAGRVEQAVDEARRAEQSDPISTDVKGTLAMMLFYQRQYAAAAAKAEEAIALDGQQPGSHFIRGRALAGIGRLDEAAREMETTVRLSGDQPGQLAELGRVYALAGRRPEAEAILSRLTSAPQSPLGFVAAQDAAYVQLGLGRRTEALTGLERGVDQRSERVLWIRVDPRLDPLHGDARFERLIQKLGGLTTAR